MRFLDLDSFEDANESDKEEDTEDSEVGEEGVNNDTRWRKERRGNNKKVRWKMKKEKKKIEGQDNGQSVRTLTGH